MAREFVSPVDLDRAEQMAVKGESAVHQLLASCVSEIRRLQHELNDPNYSYSGRIHRQAILCREAEIDSLRDQLKKLKADQQEVK